jgi:methionyl-tRNA formyltransferase
MTKPHSIVFMGTADFAVPALEYLIQSNQPPCLVVTQPDRPQGRGRKLLASPVKEAALKAGIRIAQPERVAKNQLFFDELSVIQPDLIVVAAYGQILPKAILDLPKFGCINLHGSILPAYRGAAPIQWSIINGEKESGVTLMDMSVKMDAGDILAVKKIKITPQDTYGSLLSRLKNLSPKLLELFFTRLDAGERMQGAGQIESDVTFAPMIGKEMAEIDWRKPADEIVNFIHGLNPKPAAQTWLGGKRFKILRAQTLEKTSSTGQAGEVVNVSGNLDIATGSGQIRLLEVLPESRPKVLAQDFLRSGKVKVGDRLGAKP